MRERWTHDLFIHGVGCSMEVALDFEILRRNQSLS
ncbi:unnamed protein product [Rhodiola kirilowii]